MRRRALLLMATMAAALVLASGVALAITKQCQANVSCFGTPDSDELLGTESFDYIYGRGAADILRGFGFDDRLFGQAGSDQLFGGSGDDFLDGGPGSDDLNGQAGDDDYRFEANEWGKDTISDTSLSDNKPFFGNQVGFKDPISTDLTIKLVSGTGPEVKNSSGTNTVNWSNNAIDNVSNSSSGDDKIYGNNAANSIHSYTGFDQVFARGGNDYIDVTDGGSDTVDCGAGTDTVDYDAPDPGPPATRGDTLTNCEDRHPYPPF